MDFSATSYQCVILSAKLSFYIACYFHNEEPQLNELFQYVSWYHIDSVISWQMKDEIWLSNQNWPDSVNHIFNCSTVSLFVVDRSFPIPDIVDSFFWQLCIIRSLMKFYILQRIVLGGISLVLVVRNMFSSTN